MGILAMLLLAALAGGCDDIKLKGGAGAKTEHDAATTWPFVPVSMRVHPFTAIDASNPDGPLTLEARLETLDRLGDVTKAVGDFRFVLYHTDLRASQPAAHNQVLYEWSVQMTTLDQNRQHWDSITRTYLFKLQMAQLPTRRGQLLLVVGFTDPGGRHLTAEAVVALGRDDN